MSPSGAEFIRQIKAQIDETDPSVVHELIGNGVAIVDVRETEEFATGHLPGARHVPRGLSRVADRGDRPRPRPARDPLLRLGQPQRAGRAHARQRPRLRARRVDDRRNHAVEGPRLRGRGPQALSAEQRDRYSRHILIPEIGESGQRKLLEARVLLLGAGGLGSPTALYLAAAGVGTIGIVDNDVVDLSNLQRQVIHNTERIGVPKVDSAEETIKALNPDVEVVKYQTRLDASNIMEIIERLGRDRRRRSTTSPRATCSTTPRCGCRSRSSRRRSSASTASSRCSSPMTARATAACSAIPPPAELAPSCGANGVLGVLPGTMGLLQATEVIKLIVGAGDPAIGRLLLYDALAATLTEVKVRRDPECAICSRDPDSITDAEMGVFPDYEAFCAAAG